MKTSLNSSQASAVQTTRGRVLILAGAGSGKTSVLTHRMAHLVLNCHVDPKNILGLTFTNKAASEMRERIEKMLPSSAAKHLTLCTFHSFCMKILRDEIELLGYTKNFSLYDEKDIKRILLQLTRQILQHDGDLPSIEPTIAAISKAKNKGSIPEEDTIWHDNFTKELFQGLQVSLRAYNAVDFDSLLSLTIELFEKFPNVLEKYQDRYQYIMIDEYQDTNPIQYRLAQFLAKKHGNLCVVGDDDQSIYGWRGAEVKHILEFDADHTVKLEQNYRSTPIILQAANAVISNNKERHKKELWSQAERGEPIVLFHAPSEREEAESVAQRIAYYHKQHNIPWNEIAVLYRSNILARALESAMMQTVWDNHGKWVRGIPYQVFGGTEFFERSEIRDLIAYLRVIANPQDQEALLRIINTPRRGISSNCLDILTQRNRKGHTSLWKILKEVQTQENDAEISDKGRNGILSFVSIIEEAQEKFKEGSLSSALQTMIDKIDYYKAIKEEVKSDKMREFKLDNVKCFVEQLKKYEEDPSTSSPSLTNFLENTALDQSKWDPTTHRENSVSLMTFHSAKGLEFKVCFLVGLEDHIIPHEKSLKETGVEEERRLMYVAMTRAKKHLVLSMSRNRKKMGKDIATTPSRFLFEIPKELLKITSFQTIA